MAAVNLNPRMLEKVGEAQHFARLDVEHDLFRKCRMCGYTCVCVCVLYISARCIDAVLQQYQIVVRKVATGEAKTKD